MKRVIFKFQNGQTEEVYMDGLSVQDTNLFAGTFADQEHSTDPQDWLESFNDWDIEEGNVARKIAGDCIDYFIIKS